ncbi:interferon-related developmental regulator-domain-containing protein [Nemania sp. FL0031]|nr:interferon-related developmental regulator-domain-containing protein [Nemania sp. FL0031]
MHDLRKKILLESGKTVSKKARSRPASLRASPNSSPTPSRGASRLNSRYASEEENNTDSDYENSLTNSVADSDDGNEPVAEWAEKLGDLIAELTDLQRKKSSAEGRTTCLSAYTHIIRHHYAEEELESKLERLITALLDSVRGDDDMEETLSAIKALSMTIISTGSEAFYDKIYQSLEALCQDSEEEALKVQAIEAMGIVTVCGGGSKDAAVKLLDFLVKIVEQDRPRARAARNGPVVSAALTAWGFVASNLDLEEFVTSGLDDPENQSGRVLHVFTEQLDSKDVDVQAAAGTNIALIFEAVREYEDTEEQSLDLQHVQHEIIERISALARESSKSVSIKDRKQLHTSFQSVLTSLEHGTGPRYSTARRMASNPHTGGNKTDFGEEYQEYGYREKIRFHNIRMVIDTWSLWTQVETLRSVLGAGLAVHYPDNPVVKDLLSSGQVEFVSAPKKKNRGRKGGK